MVRDLNLLKNQPELLGSRSKGWNILYPDAKISYFRNRDQRLKSYFAQDGDLVYCNNMNAIMGSFEIDMILRSGVYSLTLIKQVWKPFFCITEIYFLLFPLPHVLTSWRVIKNTSLTITYQIRFDQYFCKMNGSPNLQGNLRSQLVKKKSFLDLLAKVFFLNILDCEENQR